MTQNDPELNEYESKSIEELKKEIYKVRKNIVILKNEIKRTKLNGTSQFAFLMCPPPKSEPSILKKAPIDIEILDSSPKLPSNDNSAGIQYDNDPWEKKHKVNPEKIKKNFRDSMNMDLEQMTKTHNEEVKQIKFEPPNEANIKEYFHK